MTEPTPEAFRVEASFQACSLEVSDSLVSDLGRLARRYGLGCAVGRAPAHGEGT
jgi:thiamine monophosphate kinase